MKPRQPSILEKNITPLLVIIIIGVSGYLFGSQSKSASNATSPTATAPATPAVSADQVSSIQQSLANPVVAPATPATTAAPTNNPNGLININTASSAELDTLPGIGPATAQKIIDYRNANGAFAQIEDIMNVNGIGQKKFDDIKSKITI